MSLSHTESSVPDIMNTLEYELSKKELASILRIIAYCRNAETQFDLVVLLEQLANLVPLNQAIMGTCRNENTNNMTRIQPIMVWKMDQHGKTDRIQKLQDHVNILDQSNKPCLQQKTAQIEWMGMDGLLRSCQLLGRRVETNCIYINKNSDHLPMREKTIFEHVIPHLLDGVHRVYIRASTGKIPSLTTREKEILKLVIQGNKSWAIAQILGISERTVKFHLGNIYAKFGVNTRVQVASLAMEFPLI